MRWAASFDLGIEGEKPIPTTAAHKNNFGLLRLLLAAAVVVSHSPEVVDGNRSREILSRVFGTLSFGEVGVDGFFLVSGYLITKSFAEHPQLFSYLLKRVARIVPGYLVSYWLCILVLAPCVGAGRSAFSPHTIGIDILRNGLLLSSRAPGAFHGLPHPYLNAPMWTIRFEFLCYITVAAIGLMVVWLKPVRFWLRWALLFLVLAGVVVNGSGILPRLVGLNAIAGANAVFDPASGHGFWGLLSSLCRFYSVFGVGSIFYFFKDRISLTSIGAVSSASLLILLFFREETAEAAFMIFGGYLIFWFALKFRALHLSAIAGRNDISYGLYLYAWPIQNLFVWNDRTIDPIWLCIATLACAGFAGFLSWHLLEKHAVAMAHKKTIKPPCSRCTAPKPPTRE